MNKAAEFKKPETTKQTLAPGYNFDPLTPPSNPICVTEERFIFNNQVTLILKEKLFSISGDDFKVKDNNNVEYFKCKGTFYNIKDKKVLYDLYDKPILTIKNKTVMSLKRKITIYSEESSNVITRFEPVSIITKKFIIKFFNKATQKEEYIEIKSDIFGFDCGVYYGKQKEGAPLIAVISYKFNGKTLFTDSDAYSITIMPGVDAAFMVALAICFDENKSHDNPISYGTDILDWFI